MLLIAVLLGAHKPAEYARFLILPVSIFAIGAGVAIGALAGVVRAVRSADVARCAPWRRPLALVVTVVVVATMKTPIYVRSFIDDAAGQDESRRRAPSYSATYRCGRAHSRNPGTRPLRCSAAGFCTPANSVVAAGTPSRNRSTIAAALARFHD